MAAIYDRVLTKYGYSLDNTNTYSGGINTKGPVTKTQQSPDYLGSVFNSIKSGIGAIPGVAQKAASDWMRDAQISGKGIAQFAPNILFGTNTTTQNGRSGGYVPGVANLVAPWASPLFQQQANANSGGKATFLDNALATPYAQIADVNKNQAATMGALKDARRKLDAGHITQDQYNAVVKGTQMRLKGDNQTLQGIGNEIVDPKKFALGFGNVVTTPFAFGKFQGVGKAGSLLSKAETVLGATKEAQSFMPNAKNVASTLLKAPLKQELINKPNVESAINIPGQLAEGKYADAAMNAGSFAVPGLLAGGTKLAKGAGKIIGDNIFSTAGVFDHVKLKGGGTVNDAFKLFSKQNSELAPKQVKIVENKLKVIQDLVLQESNGNAKLAAQNMARYQSEMNKFGKLDLPQFVNEFDKLLKSRVAAQKQGFDAVARLTHADKKVIADRLSSAEDMSKELARLKKEGVIKNTNLYGQLQDIIKSGDSKYVKSAVNELTAADPLLKNGKAVEFGNGYFGIKQGAAGVVRDAKDTKGLIQGKDARLGIVGDVLRKAGISPEQVTSEDNRYAFNKFKEAFTKKIDGTDSRSGKEIYNSLNKLANETMGVTDIRQLTKRKIADKLNLSTTEAGKILKAAKDSYKVLSVQERGLAGKLMDFNLRVNPIAGQYSRAQSIARYEKNPFFRLQENIETRAGIAALGGKQAIPRTNKYDETIKKLDKGLFTSGYGGEGADNLSGSFTGVGAKLSRDQRANIAATVEKFAGGPDKVDKWLVNPKNADILNDIKTVVQYPDKGFSSSNMAKMLNLVSFPSRYNLKVTGFAVKQLAKQPAMTQIATIRALGDFNEFAKSPEGIKWQADNKEAIGLFKYFTPIMPIASVHQTLTGQDKSLMDTGMIGGLPFGVITRALHGQGILKDRVPYVDPRTGKVFSDEIPQDAKAKAQSLLESVIDTLYTYPGRTVGATSKKEVTKGVAENLSFGQFKGGKYDKVDRSKDVTPEQQRQIDILKAGQSSGQTIRPSASLGLNTTKRPTSIRPAPIYKAKRGKKAKPIAKPIASLI